MDLLDSIKNDVKKSGTNKGKFVYFREGQKQRVRFLVDMDDGMAIDFHDSYERGINVPCQSVFGRDCPHCGDEGLRTRSQYVWSVYNYETKEVQLFMFPVNNCSPVPALVAMYENYGTLTDRDYVISVSGKQQNKTYSVVPMDKVRFRNDRVKPYSEKAILKMIDKAYPCDVDDDDEEDEPKPRRSASSAGAAKKQAPKRNTGRDRDGDDEEDDEEESGNEYESMTDRELYRLCKERGIDVRPKKSSKYYIKQLEEYDAAQDDWSDDEDGEEEDDDWEDDE